MNNLITAVLFVAEETVKDSNIALIITTVGSVLIALFTLITSASKKRVSELEASLTDVKGNYDTLDKTVVRLEAENTRLSDENEKLRSRVAVLENSAVLTGKEINDLKCENQNLKDRITFLTTDNDRLEKENQALRDRVSQLENKKQV